MVSAFDEACLKLFCSDDTFIVATASNLKITIDMAKRVKHKQGIDKNSRTDYNREASL